MFKSTIAMVVALLSVPTLIGAANAAPAGLGSAKPAIAADTATAPTQIHWRKKHHRHYYRSHGPSVRLYIGPGKRHHRHRRWHRKWH